MNPERESDLNQKKQVSAELRTIADEQLKQLEENRENAPDNQNERAEQARKIIEQQERPAEEPLPAAEHKQPSHHHHPIVSHLRNYADTLRGLQRQLPPASRAFSQFIHTPVVEKTSEVLEKTVARPSVTAGALWTALIVGGLFYFLARHYGFNLSGSELTLSLLAGAIIGLGLEYVWRLLRRPRHK